MAFKNLNQISFWMFFKKIYKTNFTNLFQRKFQLIFRKSIPTCIYKQENGRPITGHKNGSMNTWEIKDPDNPRLLFSFDPNQVHS